MMPHRALASLLIAQRDTTGGIVVTASRLTDPGEVVVPDVARVDQQNLPAVYSAVSD